VSVGLSRILSAGTGTGRDLGTDPAAAAANLLRGRVWAVLTGAGISTDSGIPDYRGPTSIRAAPMQYGEFVSSAEAQRRYWARSFLGWRRIGQARPNDGHKALVELEAAGLIGVITQNVDGLHAAAGSSAVINLHGEIAAVVCLDCGGRESRRAVQDRLASLNPSLDEPPTLEHAELRPDGDAVVREWHDFVLAPCVSCGGRLKPDVVFFGEQVPRARVESAYRLVDEGDVLVVAGSSLTVMSGLRFVRHNTKHGKSVVIINRGLTRGDDLATIKIDAGCSETLTSVARELQRVA
jgi:NAD-dependent SIR2 family protein deacetylase